MSTPNPIDAYIKELVSIIAPPLDAVEEENVKSIIADVKNNGDSAIIRYSKLYDGVDLAIANVTWSRERLEKYVATLEISDELKKAVEVARKNIEFFTTNSMPREWSATAPSGQIVGARFQPIDSVACYVPGGSFPLASTVLHTCLVAKTAGVKRITMVTPPSINGLDPMIAYCAFISGVDRIVFAGGAQGIAAVAYGTKTIKKVDFVCGPGNRYVSLAKKLVFGDVGIDMIAGPSEVFVIADETARAYDIACDLIAQAEHGSGFESSVLLATTNELIRDVETEIDKLLETYSEDSKVYDVYKKYMYALKVKDVDFAIEVANAYAPEHVEIITENSREDAKKITRAGAIFVGPYSPEPIGDYVAGPSHVLPTNSTAKFSSGISAATFMTRISILDCDEDSYRKLAPAAKALAEVEGLTGHALSAVSRLKHEE